jgi:hypothetical protein
MVYALYDGRVVDMGYIDQRKDRFKFAAMRIRDNGASGYVVDDRRLVYVVAAGKKMAVRADEQVSAIALRSVDAAFPALF